jgi:ribosomal protein S18 acetylase RimI-like enzyme
MTAVIAVRVDEIRPTDESALERLFARCTVETVRDRFFAPLSSWPRRYLAGALAGDPRQHDALVVRCGDGVAALGSLVAGPGSGSHRAELGVLVADRWQRRGLGVALVDGLVARARERGVEELVASVLPNRIPLLRALGRRLPMISLAADDDCLTGVFAVSSAPGS